MQETKRNIFKDNCSILMRGTSLEPIVQSRVWKECRIEKEKAWTLSQNTVENVIFDSDSCKVACFITVACSNVATFHEAESMTTFSTVQK